MTSLVIGKSRQPRYVKSRKENPQKLTQLSSRYHPRHLVGKRTAQKDTIIDITSDSQEKKDTIIDITSDTRKTAISHTLVTG